MLIPPTNSPHGFVTGATLLYTALSLVLGVQFFVPEKIAVFYRDAITAARDQEDLVAATRYSRLAVDDGDKEGDRSLNGGYTGGGPTSGPSTGGGGGYTGGGPTSGPSTGGTSGTTGGGGYTGGGPTGGGTSGTTGGGYNGSGGDTSSGEGQRDNQNTGSYGGGWGGDTSSYTSGGADGGEVNASRLGEFNRTVGEFGVGDIGGALGSAFSAAKDYIGKAYSAFTSFQGGTNITIDGVVQPSSINRTDVSRVLGTGYVTPEIAKSLTAEQYVDFFYDALVKDKVNVTVPSVKTSGVFGVGYLTPKTPGVTTKSEKDIYSALETARINSVLNNTTIARSIRDQLSTAKITVGTTQPKTVNLSTVGSYLGGVTGISPQEAQKINADINIAIEQALKKQTFADAVLPAATTEDVIAVQQALKANEVFQATIEAAIASLTTQTKTEAQLTREEQERLAALTNVNKFSFINGVPSEYRTSPSLLSPEVQEKLVAVQSLENQRVVVGLVQQTAYGQVFGMTFANLNQPDLTNKLHNLADELNQIGFLSVTVNKDVVHFTSLEGTMVSGSLPSDPKTSVRATPTTVGSITTPSSLPNITRNPYDTNIGRVTPSFTNPSTGYITARELEVSLAAVAKTQRRDAAVRATAATLSGITAATKAIASGLSLAGIKSTPTLERVSTLQQINSAFAKGLASIKGPSATENSITIASLEKARQNITNAVNSIPTKTTAAAERTALRTAVEKAVESTNLGITHVTRQREALQALDALHAKVEKTLDTRTVNPTAVTQLTDQAAKILGGKTPISKTEYDALKKEIARTLTFGRIDNTTPDFGSLLTADEMAMIVDHALEKTVVRETVPSAVTTAETIKSITTEIAKAVVTKEVVQPSVITNILGPSITTQRVTPTLPTTRITGIVSDVDVSFTGTPTTQNPNTGLIGTITKTITDIGKYIGVVQTNTTIAPDITLTELVPDGTGDGTTNLTTQQTFWCQTLGIGC